MNTHDFALHKSHGLLPTGVDGCREKATQYAGHMQLGLDIHTFQGQLFQASFVGDPGRWIPEDRIPKMPHEARSKARIEVGG